jgi:hypothetical protein
MSGTDPQLDINALLSATEAMKWARVNSVQVITNWHRRGLLPIARDDHGREIRVAGRPRYRLLDVAKAKRAAELNAARMAARLHAA